MVNRIIQLARTLVTENEVSHRCYRTEKQSPSQLPRCRRVGVPAAPKTVENRLVTALALAGQRSEHGDSPDTYRFWPAETVACPSAWLWTKAIRLGSKPMGTVGDSPVT